MTTKLKLPYVDGIPEDGQRRLSWIRDGELLEGAKSRYGSEGNLNLMQKQLQENIVVIANEIDNANASNAIIEDELEKIKEILADVGNTSLIEQVNENKNNIDGLKDSLDTLDEYSKGVEQSVTDLKSLVGSPIQFVDGNLTAFENLHFIKSVIGNEKDFDVNGDSAPNTPESGLIAKINSAITQTIENKGKIDNIEAELAEANLSELEAKVSNIRSELGGTPNGKTIYSRLNAIEDNEVEVDSRIDKINESIGTESVTKRIDSVNVEISDIKTEINGTNGIKASISKLDDTVFTQDTGLVSRVSSVENTSNALNSTVNDPESGLVKAIENISSTIGLSDSSPNTILGRINTLELNTGNTATTVQDMQVTLGDGSSGLVADVNASSKSLYGNAEAEDPVDKAGVVAATKTVYNGLNTTNAAVKALYDRLKYSGLTFSSLSDATYTDNAEQISSLLNMSLAKSVKVDAGVALISQQNDFQDAIKSDVILINIGTYDYAFNTVLGTIADAVDDFSGSATFYSELYSLLSKVSTATSKSRVFVTNGYRTTQFTNGVKYPNKNTEGKALEDYSKAILDVASIFGIPVIDTNNELGIHVKNSGLFLNTTGFTVDGSKRFVNLVTGFINSK